MLSRQVVWLACLVVACLRAADCLDVQGIDSAIQQSFACRQHNPGLAVAVVKDGKVVFSKGYGVSDVTSGAAVTPDTLFGIASISKSFAATLLVKLLSEKNKSVDDKVSSLLGEKFQMPDDVRRGHATFADLMAHRMAIPPNNKLRFDSNLTRENLLERVSHMSAPHQFRVKYFYSNLMYGVVTRLAEVLGGRRWEDLVRQHLFNPLGMTRSTFATDADWSDPAIATGYQLNRTSDQVFPVEREFSRRWAMLAGSGAVFSSANDMAKWMNFHLSGGKDENGVTVMKKDHLKQVHKSRFLISSTPDKDTRKPEFPVTASSDVYAHGLRKGFYRGFERLDHTGATFGYRAMMSLIPGEKVGVFTALTGRDDNYMFRVPLQMHLLDLALGLQPWLNTSTLCSYPAPWKTPKEPTKPKPIANRKLPRPAIKYEGKYFNKAYGIITVDYNSTLTSLVMTYGWGQWRLKALKKDDTFYGSGMGLTKIMDLSLLEFRTGQSDKSQIIDIKATSFETKSPPVFRKLRRSRNSPGQVMGAKASSPTVHGKTWRIAIELAFITAVSFILTRFLLVSV